MIALVTADLSGQPFDDMDRPPLEQAFAGRAPARFVRWDDATVDWAGFELVVLRSTWDYTGRLAEFRLWLDQVSATGRLLNPAPTVLWNVDKAYLGQLRDGGVPVAATGYLDTLAGFDADLATLTSREVVVKPSVSAGSDHTGRFDRDDPAARELAGRILELGKQVMLQPYYESVGRQGEVSVVHFDGEFSHAFRKGPILDRGGAFFGGDYTEVVEPVAPTDVLLSAAEAALDCYQGLVGTEAALAGAEPLLYSRVDLIEDDEGRPRCLELELVEPSFFFETDPKAADRFVSAVLRRL